MRYSQAAASLLSTVFTFQAKSLVVDAGDNNIFNPTIDPEEADVGALAPTTENKKNKRAKYLAFKELKQKCKEDEGNFKGCVQSALAGRGDGDNKGAKRHADIGILAAAGGGGATSNRTTPTSSSSGGSSTWIARAVPSTCTAGFVECKDGYLVSDDTTTCYAECAGDCCKGYDYYGDPVDGCAGFTGKVCKDGSCNGYDACEDATIPSVVNSCKYDGACENAGRYGGLIKSMVDSCNGYYACSYAAQIGGTIGNILGSCNEDLACGGAATLYGSIGDITESCIGLFACDDLGQGYGKVGNVVKSCLGYRACDDVAEGFGLIGDISGSCIGDKSCYYLGKFGGTVGVLSGSCTAYQACMVGALAGGTIVSITNSCSAEYSCRGLAGGVGKVGGVKDSCNALYSCQKAGYNRGSLGSITTSRSAEDACLGAGSGTAGAITSNLKNCCNAASTCESATQATLPAQCKNSKVRKCDVFAPKLNQLSIPFYYLSLIYSLSSTKSTLDILGGEGAKLTKKQKITRRSKHQ